jgi:hypothetical protein
MGEMCSKHGQMRGKSKQEITWNTWEHLTGYFRMGVKVTSHSIYCRTMLILCSYLRVTA